MATRKHRIVFLNGPPRSGKDEAGVALLRGIDETRLYAMKRPLDGALRGFWGVSEAEWAAWEQRKDELTDEFPFGNMGDMTHREQKISFSEEWAKQKFGQPIFGRLAASFLTRDHGHVRYALTAITDSGFASEAQPIVDTFGAQHCLCLQLHRAGRTFEGDSRTYWRLDGVETRELHNNDLELDMWHKLVVRCVSKWMGIAE